MKKLIYYLIFLLALVMMLLACSACRSPKTMTYSKATTDSLNLRVRDSTAQRFEFTFDSLELWSELRNLGTSELRKMAPLGYSFFESDKSITEFPNLRSSFFESDKSMTGISHHAVIYGGKLLSDKTRSMSQDSTLSHSSTQAQHSELPRFRSSVIPYAIALAMTIALLLLFYKLRSKVSS